MDKESKPLNKIRRDNLAKDDSWIEEKLIQGAVGAIATCVENQPFLVTRNYIYEPNTKVIYLHGALQGRTFNNIRVNNQVCFSVSEMGRLLPADDAIAFGVEYSGVVVFGRIQLIDDEKEAIHGLELLLQKYFPHLIPGEDYKPISPEALKITAVFRIDIDSWSGKEVKEQEFFPGAFTYPFDLGKFE